MGIGILLLEDFSHTLEKRLYNAWYILKKSKISENLQLEFVEMATKWLGYSPRGQGHAGGVEQLIAEKEALVIETNGAIKIQSSKTQIN